MSNTNPWRPDLAARSSVILHYLTEAFLKSEAESKVSDVNRRAALYTKGSIYFYETYPGSYPPRSLFLDCTHAQKSVRDLAWECLALSKMNWNNTRFDGLLPITLRAAKQVGSILKYLKVKALRRFPQHIGSTCRAVDH